MGHPAAHNVRPLAPPRVYRRLDTSELIFHAMNLQGALLTAQVLTLRGPLDQRLVRRALNHLQARYPLLRMTVAGLEAPSLVESSDPAELLVLDSDSDPIGALEAELHRPYQLSGGVPWRCLLVPASAVGGVHHLVLAIPHAIADGRSSMRIVADLLSACVAVARGTPPPPALPLGQTLDQVLPPPPWRALIAHRMRRARARLGYEGTMLARDPAEPGVERRSAVVVGRLERREVGQLQEVAHANGATVTGALMAALLRATRASFGRDLRLEVSQGVCLRSAGRPQVPAEQVGCFIAGITTAHRPDPQQPFWGEARGATRAVQARVRRGDPVAALHAARGSYSRLVEGLRAQAANRERGGRTAPLGLSNRGRFDPGPISPFELVDLWFATSTHTIGTSLQLCTITHPGGLTCSLTVPEPLVARARAAKVLGGVMAELQAAAGLPGLG